LRGQDLNLRPSGYEPDELPDCSTPRQRRGRTVQKFGIFVNRRLLRVQIEKGFSPDSSRSPLEQDMPESRAGI
jgi:hypothetical protein